MLYEVITSPVGTWSISFRGQIALPNTHKNYKMTPLSTFLKDSVENLDCLVNFVPGDDQGGHKAQHLADA